MRAQCPFGPYLKGSGRQKHEQWRYIWVTKCLGNSYHISSYLPFHSVQQSPYWASRGIWCYSPENTSWGWPWKLTVGPVGPFILFTDQAHWCFGSSSCQQCILVRWFSIGGLIGQDGKQGENLKHLRSCGSPLVSFWRLICKSSVKLMSLLHNLLFLSACLPQGQLPPYPPKGIFKPLGIQVMALVALTEEPHDLTLSFSYEVEMDFSTQLWAHPDCPDSAHSPCTAHSQVEHRIQPAGVWPATAEQTAVG